MNYVKSLYSMVFLLTMLLLSGCAGPLSIAYRPGVIPDLSQAKGHPVILLKPYVDIREGVEPHYIGKVTEVVTDMNSDKILLDKEKKEDVATFVTGAMRSHLTAAGFIVKDWSQVLEDSNETDLILSGEVKRFRLDIGPRDEIDIEIASSLTSKKSGKVLWAGVVSEKDDKYAGVMGNSRKTIAGYISKSLRTAINKTLKEVNENIQMAVITGIKDMSIPEGVGRLVIRTEPPRAEVYTGAIYHGMSPLSIYLEPGISEVTFRLKGFKEMREKVSIRNMDVTEIDRILEKE